MCKQFVQRIFFHDFEKEKKNRHQQEASVVASDVEEKKRAEGTNENIAAVVRTEDFDRKISLCRVYSKCAINPFQIL